MSGYESIAGTCAACGGVVETAGRVVYREMPELDVASTNTVREACGCAPLPLKPLIQIGPLDV